MAQIVSIDNGQITWDDGSVTDTQGNPINLGNGAGTVDQGTDVGIGTSPTPVQLDPVTVVGHSDPTPTPSTPATPVGNSSGLQQYLQSLNLDPATIQSIIGGAGTVAAGLNSANALNKAADTYTNLGQKYATQLDPYGAYRKAAADKLAALQADPSSITNTPGYQFSLSQGLGAVANRDNQRFGMGAGSTNPDLMTFAQGLASKTYNDTISQYSNQAGVGISPAAAASVLQTGLQGSIAARLGATNSINAINSGLTQPGGTVTRTTTGSNNGSTNTGGSTGGSLVSNLVSGAFRSIGNATSGGTYNAGTVPIGTGAGYNDTGTGGYNTDLNP